MSFTDSKIGYESVRDNLISLFQNNKTALNSGLDYNSFSSNNQIEAGDPDIVPMLRGTYPRIMVEFINKSEEDRGVGASHTKTPTITYRVYGIVSVRKDYEDLDGEVMTLLDNIEGLIRDNISDVSGTMWVVPRAAEKASGQEKGTYVSIVALDVEAVVEVS